LYKIPGVRSSDIEKRERVQIIAKLILEGYSNPRMILQAVADKYDSWGKEERSLYYYIEEAKELLAEISKNEIEFEKNLALNRLEALYTMNYKIQDFRECRNIVEARVKMLGINAPTKVEVTNTEKTYEDFMERLISVKDGFNDEVSGESEKE